MSTLSIKLNYIWNGFLVLTRKEHLADYTGKDTGQITQEGPPEV